MLRHLASITLGITMPVAGLSLPAVAQQQFQLNTAQLQPGTVIPASIRDTAGTQYYYANTAYDLSLRVDQPIYNSAGRVAIPAGSQISGTLQPVAGGSQFVADTLTTGTRAYPIQASSSVIPDQKDPRQYSSGSVAEDAAIGAAAGAILGAVTGEVDPGEVVGGAAAGAGIGNVTAPRVVVLNPSTTVQVTLDNSLVI